MKKELTDQEVLQKAIEMAIENGYEATFSVRENLKEYMSFKKYYAIIFSREFAKAFWKDESDWFMPIHGIWKDLREKDKDKFMYQICGRINSYHLQLMVLENNPINYLRKFIKHD